MPLSAVKTASFLAALGLTIACTATQAATSCKIETTTYKLAGSDTLSAGFKNIGKFNGWPSDLAFHVDTGKSSKQFWFLFDRGSAPHINLISTDDVRSAGWTPPDPDGGHRPLGQTQYLAADSDDRFFPDIIPISEMPAPEKILVPDLPLLIQHLVTPGEAVPHAFFIIDHCGR